MDNKDKFNVSDTLVKLQHMNYMSIIDTLSPIIESYTNKKIKQYRVKLNKEFKLKDISKVTIPEELKQINSSLDVEKIVSKIYGENILEFANFLVKNFKEEYLINFYNNINDLEVKKINIDNFFRNILIIKVIAAYNTKDNLMVVDSSQVNNNITYLKQVLYHELFHMASSYHKDGKYYSGFHQTTDGPDFLDIGISINEGYTELLTERYLSDISTTSTSLHYKPMASYNFEKEVMKKIEDIIGRETMEKLYFRADLHGLIDELSQYANEDEIANFISCFDYASSYSNDPKHEKILYEIDKVHESIDITCEFLLKIYIKKLKKDFDDGLISKDNCFRNIDEYTISLFNMLRQNSYYDYKIERSKEIIKEVFGDYDKDTSTSKSALDYYRENRDWINSSWDKSIEEYQKIIAEKDEEKGSVTRR